MKLSFLAQRNIVNAGVVVALFMPTMVVGGTIIAKDSNPSPADATSEGTSTIIMTNAEMLNWLTTTDAELTFVGDSISDLSSFSADTTTVTYCNKRVDDVCGGSCTVYTGGAKCLSAPDTQCLAATNNVGFCDKSGCSGSCNQLSSCGTRLSNGFCYTPGTESITVGAD